MYLVSEVCPSLILTLCLHTLLLELKIWMNGQRVATVLTFPHSLEIQMGVGLGEHR